MPSVRWRRELSAAFAPLIALFGAAVVAFVRGQAWPGAWLLALPPALAVLLDLDGVGDRLRRRGERDAWLLVGLAIVAGAGWTLYALVDERLFALLRAVIGSGLVLMGSFFVAGRRVWRAGRGLLPVSLALLAVAALDPLAPLRGALLVAAVALLAWLLLERPRLRPREAERRLSWRPLLVLVPSALLALGIARLLPWAQPFVEQALAGALAGPQAVTGMAGASRLGDIERLSLSREVMFRLWSEAPLRLRARVFTHFDGQRWSAPPAATPRSLSRVERPHPERPNQRFADLPGTTYRVEPADGTPLDWAVVLPSRLDYGILVTPPGPRLLRVAGGAPLADGLGGLSAPFYPPPRIFGIGHALLPAQELAEPDRAAALQVPEMLDPRVAGLARELAAGASSDAQRLDRTLAWLAREHRYALDARFTSPQPLAEFLFEVKRGYCEYFATGAAMLLRLQGVPARYVSGFSVPDGSRHGDHYVVRASHAHAWIEAWLPEAGWVEADPTPAAQFAAMHQALPASHLDELWESLSAALAELRARFAHDWRHGLDWLAGRLGAWASAVLPDVAWPLGALAVAWSVVVAWRHLRPEPRFGAAGGGRSASGVRPAVAGLLSRVDAGCAARGHPRPPHRAPLEHLDALPAGVLEGVAMEASRAVIACYYRECFGGRPAGQAELSDLDARLEALRGGTPAP